MNPNRAEILAGLAGAGTFLGTLLVLGLPWWLCLVLTGLIYAGANLYLGGLFEDKVQEMMSGTQKAVAQMSERITENKRTVRALRGLSTSIQDPGIREKLVAICAIAEKIFLNFEQDPEDIKRAHRFLSQFQKLLPIIEDYAHLTSDPDRRAVLTDEDEQNIRTTLDAFLSNLKQSYQAFQDNNLMKLRMSTGVLKRMIDMDESVSRRERSSS